MAETEDTSHFNSVTSHDTQYDDSNNSFLQRECSHCNGQLTMNVADNERHDHDGETIQLLYGLHDSPGVHISFLCGLQVNIDHKQSKDMCKMTSH